MPYFKHSFMDLNKIGQKAKNITITVGDFIKNEITKIGSNDVETKSLNSLVTYVDKEAEKQLVKQLSELIPESGFIAEEGTSDKKGKYNWIIDPLDGTTNFIHGLPMYSVSVALAKENEILIGIVYLPVLNECFYALKNEGAFLNDLKISTSSKTLLSDTLIATGFPYYDYGKMDAYSEILKEFMQKTRGIRRMGSAAIDLAYVACGRFDSFYEYSLNPWDVAAGSLIVQEAGGTVSDFKNKGEYLHGKEIIASNPAIHNRVFDIIDEHFNA